MGGGGGGVGGRGGGSISVGLVQNENGLVGRRCYRPGAMDARNGSGGGAAAAVVDAAIAGCPNGFLVRRQSRLSRDPIEVKIKTRKKKEN